MNLMYFKTMRGDRDSGFPTSSSKTYRSGGLGSESCDIGTGGFGSSWAGGVAQKWFNQGPTLGSTASQPAPRGTAVIPMDDLVPSPQHHLRTHLLLDLSGAEDQGSGGSRSNSSGSKHSGGKWIQPPRSDGRPDVRYQRIRGDPTAMIADPGIPGSRSVRSGLYDTEVCLTVGGLGSLKGGTVMQNNGAMCPRTGKQVTFGQRSPTGLEDPLRVRSQDPSLSRSKRDSSVRSRDSERTKTSTLPRTRSSSRQPDSKSRDDSDATYGRRRRDKGDSDLSSIDDVNLSNMQGRDCFIIPVNNVRRFLPAGVGLPRDRTGEVQILEMADPQLVVLLHFMSPLMAIQPVFESPLSRPPLIQKNLAQELLAEVLKDRPGAHGMLLCSIEHNAEYPFINYGVANRQLTVADEFQQAARFAALDKFNPSVLQYFSEHLVDSYEECATIARPPIHPASRRPVAASTGYIVSVYKVFEGDDGETFERNWLYWTGARMLYQCLPKSVGLRRITLHKSMSQGDKLYTLMCECSHFMDHVQDAAHLVPALRARLCGYSSIYKVAGVY